RRRGPRSGSGARARAGLRLRRGMLTELLALPARFGVRWPVIATVVLAAGGLYLHVLLTAPPMPPGRLPAPAGGGVQATDAVHPVR
ncbi:hypothetical protein ACFW1A_28975, partial [Kitasatospora sp. NPDC058965]|uniref:hypothetical protein n=1 Tax=Kitasatospora sp. NPDC058965 TaxID=3346682 RepID=UPI003696EDEB